MPLSAGSFIGPYEVVGWIGAGGMGEVYRARDARLSRDVAIKLIPDALAADRSRLHRFEQEARAAGQLNHPNILAIYDVGTHRSAPYIVSELLEGESLRSRLQRGIVPARKAIEYARQTAEGLAAAHDKGIVHRDLKPDNLFITKDERIKILDFGIAKLTAAADARDHTGFPTETEAGMVVGTQGYMSPEQMRGESVDARSDLFNVGAILYEMLAGRPAFVRATGADTVSAILNENPPPVAGENVPPALDRIISRCLEKSRDARFQSARDLAFGLEVLSGTSTSTAAVSAQPPPARRFWQLTGIAVVVLGVIAAAVSWLTIDRARTAAIDERLTKAAFTPITNFEGSEQDAAISPDGRFITFVSDRDGDFNVFLNQIGTGSFRNLTPGLGDQRNRGLNRSVGFTAGGSEIWINGSAETRLRVMPLMGGESRTFLAEHAVNVVWSPEGDRLVYFTYDPNDPMFVADRTGGNARQIFASPDGGHNHFPAWSIDGSWIYYAHGIQASSEFDVWRIRPAGGEPERLTYQNRDVRYLTPIDAHTLLYVAPDEDKSGPWLWALDVDRKATHRLNTGLERYLSVAASADGHRLVAAVANTTANLWTVPILDRIADERDVKPYPIKSSRALAPRFAANGALYYLSSSGPGDGLWRSEHDAVSEIWNGSNGALVEPAGISPRGDWLLIVLNNSGKQQLTLVSADGASHHTFRDDLDVRGTSSWSPDGNWIVTGGRDARGPGLFKIPVADGPAVRLVSGEALDPVWSPDGTVIVYTGVTRATAPLLAVRPDGTAVTLPAIEVPFAGGRRGRSRFLPDGNLIFVQGRVGTEAFWRLDLKNGRTSQLTRLSSPGTMLTFDITPDGRQIVFDRVRENSDIRLIELK